MGELRGACIFGQSGGPTSVINASAYGVISQALKEDCITNVYAAEYGIKGVLADHIKEPAAAADPQYFAYFVLQFPIAVSARKL